MAPPFRKEEEEKRALEWLLSPRFIRLCWPVFCLLFFATLGAFLIFKNQTETRLSLLFAHRQEELAAAIGARLEEVEFTLRAAAEAGGEDARKRLAQDLPLPELIRAGHASRTGDTLRLETAGGAVTVELPKAHSAAKQETRSASKPADGGSDAAQLMVLPPAAASLMHLPRGSYLLMWLPGRDGAFYYQVIDVHRLGDYVMSTLSWKDVRLTLAPAGGKGGSFYDSAPQDAAPVASLWHAEREDVFYGLPIHFDFSALPYFGHRLGEMEYVWVVMAGGFCAFAVLGFYLVVSGQMRALYLGRDLARSRSATRRNQDLLRLFLKDAPVSVAMFDRDVRYILCSDRWKRDVGMPGQDLTGQCHYDLFPQYLTDNPDVKNRVRRILAGEQITEDKLRVTRPDGGWDYIRYEARPWRNAEGMIEGIISFREIITEKIKAEEELRRYAQEVEQFAYIASHDLKAPLRGIDNLAKWIVEDMEPVMTPEVGESFRILRGRVRRLETMLDDILRYSKAGRVVEPPQAVDTGELIDSLTRLYPWGDRFRISCAGAMPVLHSPRTPLEQIFTNLISNSVKHHDRDEGSVTVRAEEHPEHWEFVVEDDGPGIPPEFHERVFGLFQTLKPRDQREGSGLGMSIIKKLVEWQGGKVWIVSEAGRRGTAVHFEWPKDFRGRGNYEA